MYMFVTTRRFQPYMDLNHSIRFTKDQKEPDTVTGRAP